VAFNLTGFDYDGTTCIPNMYRRLDGRDYIPPRSYDPVLCWVGTLGSVCRYDEMPQGATWAAGLKRFVIIDGKKNPAANDDWNIPASAWNIAAESVSTEIYIYTIKQECTLNQAVDSILALGYPIFNAGDLDSGRSTKKKYLGDVWQSSNDEVANMAAIMLGGEMTTVTRWTGNIETVKPLRDGPGGDATGVSLVKGTFVKGDEKSDRWIRLIEPGVAAGLWCSSTWLVNLKEIQEEVVVDPPPVDPPTDGATIVLTEADGTIRTFVEVV